MTEMAIVEAVRAAGTAQSAQTAMQAAQAADPAAVERFQAAMAPQASTDIPFAAHVAATFKTAESNYQGILHRIKALTELRGMHGEMERLRHDERRNLIAETAKELGFKGEDVKTITATIQEVIEATSGGFGGRRGGPPPPPR